MPYRETIVHQLLSKYTDRLNDQPKWYGPFWLSRMTGGRLPYNGLLYRPYRPFRWAEYYNDDNNSKFSRIERYNARLMEMPISPLWEGTAWIAALFHWDHRCAACGNNCRLVRDHLVPVSSTHCPGTVPSNLLPLCRDCNREKSNDDYCHFAVDKKSEPDFVDSIEWLWAWQEKCWERGWR